MMYELRKLLVILAIILGCNVASAGIKMLVEGEAAAGALLFLLGIFLYSRGYSKIEVKSE